MSGLNAPLSTRGLFQGRSSLFGQPAAINDTRIGETSAASQIRGGVYAILRKIENIVYRTLNHPLADELNDLMDRHEALQHAERAPHVVNSQQHLEKLGQLQEAVCALANASNSTEVNKTVENVTARLLAPLAGQVFGEDRGYGRAAPAA